MTKIRMILMASAALALAAPVAATADSGKDKTKSAEKAPKKAKKAPKGKNAEFKGTVKAVDAAAGTVTVTVDKASKWGRAYKGKDVVFTLAGVKKIKVADTNGDTKKDLADVKVGDRAKLGARIVKGTDVALPVAANKAHFKAPEPVPAPSPAPTTTP
jgi:ATPase subunit of ABC transporter with duplicated ATPase domains